MLTRVPTLTKFIWNLFITTSNIRNSKFPSLNISKFTKEGGATIINNEDSKELEIRKNDNFVTFK